MQMREEALLNSLVLKMERGQQDINTINERLEALRQQFQAVIQE